MIQEVLHYIQKIYIKMSKLDQVKIPLTISDLDAIENILSEMTKIKIFKVSESEDPLHPNNIPTGYVKTGFFVKNPIVGECFFVSNGLKGYFRTSIVQEIINENTFKTHNSIYKFELIN